MPPFSVQAEPILTTLVFGPASAQPELPNHKRDICRITC
jgi:hypothetical protein